MTGGSRGGVLGKPTGSKNCEDRNDPMTRSDGRLKSRSSGIKGSEETGMDDKWDQYTQDRPTFSGPVPAYTWERREQSPSPRGGMVRFGGGGAAPSADGGPAPAKGPLDPSFGGKFVDRWRASAKRARRLGKEFDQTTPQPWSGHPDDFAELTDGARGGNLSAVVSRRPGSPVQVGTDLGAQWGRTAGIA